MKAYIHCSAQGDVIEAIVLDWVPPACTRGAKSLSGKLSFVCLGEASRHQADHGDQDHGACGRGGMFIVAVQASPAGQPAERALHDPASRLNVEPDRPQERRHDHYDDPQQQPGQGHKSSVGRVGPHVDESFAGALGLGYRQSCPLTVGDVGGGDG